jgi:hypothetical protein
MAQPEAVPVTPADEAALAVQAQSDRALFGTLCERHRARIYAYLRSRTTSEDDAADLTQHVFVQALAALGHYRAQQGTFGASFSGPDLGAGGTIRRANLDGTGI